MDKKSIISIDIGSNQTKIIVGVDKDDLYVIEKALVFETSEEGYNDGKLLTPEKTAREMKSFLAGKGINIKNAAITLNGTSIITREISLPAVKPDDMENMVRYEIEQYLPIEMSQYVVEYKLLEEYHEENTKKQRIMIGAVPRAIVDNYYNLLKQMGLTPLSMDINPNTISKLIKGNTKINKDYAVSGKNIAVIDVGHKSINVNFISNGMLKFSRLINRGSSEISDNIMARLNLSPQESEIKKINVDLVNSLDIRNEFSESIYEISKGIIDEWITDIQRIFQFFESRNNNNKIEAIFLYGGGSNLKGLPQYFSSAFNIRTELIYALNSVKFSKNSEVAGGDMKLYLNAIGAIPKK